MNIIFFGSDDFALTNFEALLASENTVHALVTQPDRAKGRGLKLEPSDIKQCALKHRLPVFQPDALQDSGFQKKLKDFKSDLFVVIAYGKILPPEMLQIPYVCAMNVHGSLLPKYRGAAPVNWAIINGEKETGISIIKMNAQMDAGDIFCQAKMKITDDDNAQTLRAKMAVVSAKELIKTVRSIEQNEYTLTVQDRSQVTLAPKLTKTMGRIDWSKSAEEIHNLVRGLVSWPAAFTVWQGKTVKILETGLISSKNSAAPGTITAISDEGLTVAAGTGSLLIKHLHPESSKPMPAKSFAAGQRLAAGNRLG